MTLEFMDGSQLKVRDVFGGPRLVMGVVRDVLRIEVDPSVIEFAALKAKFKDNPNARIIYTYVDDLDKDGNPVKQKVEMGVGYTIFVSISDEQKKITPPPGKMAPDRIDEIYVVQIAQQTYEEYTTGQK